MLRIFLWETEKWIKTSGEEEIFWKLSEVQVDVKELHVTKILLSYFGNIVNI